MQLWLKRLLVLFRLGRGWFELVLGLRLGLLRGSALVARALNRLNGYSLSLAFFLGVMSIAYWRIFCMRNLSLIVANSLGV